ncbi:hypothetical protein GCM10010357_14710 [Streptomyces luteireticuli]|uniref:UTRA domain-containing protein n=2 Tax=Streptomyces luteireticuli TaxID=173858 RepID=A0ABN0YGM4_9ACTN
MHAEMSKAETALLVGGPAAGARVRVTGRPGVLQVTRPCAVEEPADGVRVEALYIYRRDLGVAEEPLRYGYDAVSP